MARETSEGARVRVDDTVLELSNLNKVLYPDTGFTKAEVIDYYTRVQKTMGGPERTAEFFRFFLAPGVAHCAGGPGPAPSGQFEALVRWVEEGRAPATLDAIRRDQTGAVGRSRVLCPYPQVARYKGKGSTDAAENFECRAG